jgi:NAD(P)-dependent dehydrogenase (short-subunit alcohol dehydrogenase family)
LLFDLTGKKLVVVGGSYGMGLASAKAAVRLGAEVAIAARGLANLEAAAAELERLGGKPVPMHTLQIEDRAAVRAFMAENAPFDHLLLPGSTVKPILYDDLTDENAREAFDSKFWGPFWACFDARPHIRRGGSIVLYSGVAAVRPVKGYMMGAAINGAINAATRSLALEFAKQGVRVNTIAPGLTDTPLNDLLHAHDKEERYKALGSRLLVGRVGHADEMAQAAVYLMCNGFVTAQVLGVDGGQQVMD